MVRPLRIEYEGAVYHVTSRGNAQSDIYLSDGDRELFLEVLALVVERFGWICHAYCLMRSKRRGEWMRQAYQEHGYTMQAIADYAVIHHSTVSRLIKDEV